MKNNIQNLIGELSKIDPNERREEYLNKCEEILGNFALQPFVYTVLNKDTTLEDIAKNRVALYCANNKFNHACIWAFSDKELAENWARRNGFMLHTRSVVEIGKPLIKPISIDELAKVTYNAVFKGVCDIVIDDGANWVCFSLKDFINAVSMNKKQQNVFTDEDFAFIQFFNKMRYEETVLFIVAGSKYSLPQILGYKFLPHVEDNTVKIFTSEKKAKEYAKEAVDNEINAVPIDAGNLNNIMVKLSLKNADCTVEIVDELMSHKYELTNMVNLMTKVYN